MTFLLRCSADYLTTTETTKKKEVKIKFNNMCNENIKNNYAFKLVEIIEYL